MKAKTQRTLQRLAKLRGYVEGRIERPGYFPQYEVLLADINHEISERIESGEIFDRACLIEEDMGTALGLQYKDPHAFER